MSPNNWLIRIEGSEIGSLFVKLSTHLFLSCFPLFLRLHPYCWINKTLHSASDYALPTLVQSFSKHSFWLFYLLDWLNSLLWKWIFLRTYFRIQIFELTTMLFRHWSIFDYSQFRNCSFLKIRLVGDFLSTVEWKMVVFEVGSFLFRLSWLSYVSFNLADLAERKWLVLHW